MLYKDIKQRLLIGLVACLLMSCDNKPAVSTNRPLTHPLDQQIQTLIKDGLGLTGNPSQGRPLPDIHTSKLAQLGKELFFSKSLSGNFDVACASCHHPLLAGADGLSLPVGVGALEPDLIGPGRRHNGDYWIDPEADGGPNVERNAPTTFNTAFYQHGLFYDGRVEAITWHQGQYIATLDQALPNKPSTDGINILFKTPDSLFRSPDVAAGDSLLQAQARLPLTSAAEMRGFATIPTGNATFRSFLAKRLRGETGELKDSRWESLFRWALDQPKQPLKQLITVDTITQALAEYQRSQVFINNPWQAYLAGKGNISDDAKKGALLFYTMANQGGAGCVSCHTGDFFTNERYYNLAIPQFGRGNFVYGQDLGRHPVTRNDHDLFAFRVPSLLNVAETAPYGHTGAFTDLATVIKHHVDPQTSVTHFDFQLQHLPQFAELGIVYPEARANTEAALKQRATMAAIPTLALNDQQINTIVAFLETLTDPCIRNANCLAPWLPTGAPPDAHRLQAKITHTFANQAPLPAIPSQPDSHSQTTSYAISNDTPAYPLNCRLNKNRPSVSGSGFTPVTQTSQLQVNRQFDFKRLKPSLKGDGLVVMEHLLFSGGVAAGDIDGDCFVDLIINQGNAADAKIYLNNQNGTFREASTTHWGITAGADLTGAMLVDLNGDGWLDLFHGNLYGASPGIYLNTGRQQFKRLPKPGFKVNHVTLGAGFGDVDGDGDLDAFLAHWSRPAKAEEEHLWLNNGHGLFKPGARQFGLIGHFGERDFTFTPNFADLNSDGQVDLLSTADFMTSQIFLNQQGQRFNNITDKKIITDQNGMGTAIADFDNDYDLDWFVTSIFYPPPTAAEQLAGMSSPLGDGNRLYRNDGIVNGAVQFSDVTSTTGVRAGGWGWGACAADFNNDGWLDIFHTNGFPLAASEVRKDLHYLFDLLNLDGFHHVLPYATVDDFMATIQIKLTNKQQAELEQLYYVGKQLDKLYLSARHLDARSKLFLNNSDGTFSEASERYGIADSGQGRGISCFDYDRDGDIDILIVNNQGNVALYRNDFGNRANFLTIKLLGEPPNVHAVGARIYLATASGRQMREVRVENNYISQNPIESHFGLGNDQQVDKLTVVWPDGSRQSLPAIKANQLFVVHKK